MITRIVRMEFVPERVPEFLEVFRASMQAIRNFPGVMRLELHQDAQTPHVYYTFSVWDSEASLEAYRGSALFQTVWASTKKHFSAPPQAFSLSKIIDVNP